MPPPSAAGGTSDHSAEVYQLQKNLATVLKENKTLKDEVKLLRGKLEQIKKIA
jgi:cell division protein FtsB